MTKICKDHSFYRRLHNCLILLAVAALLFHGLGESAWLPDSQLLRWLAVILLIISLCMLAMTLGGPYACAICHRRLEHRQYNDLQRHYCRHCDIEWVTDTQYPKH